MRLLTEVHLLVTAGTLGHGGGVGGACCWAADCRGVTGNQRAADRMWSAGVVSPGAGRKKCSHGQTVAQKDAMCFFIFNTPPTILIDAIYIFYI